MKACLSKKPSLRPTLDEILAHQFLAEHAAAQRVILALQQPAPFSTRLEKDTLHRMKAAGVDIDQVIENVLAKKCDSLAGWWALLIEKEERKERRRQKRKIESRRMSAASNLEPSLPPPAEEAEDQMRNDYRNAANREFSPVNYYGCSFYTPTPQPPESSVGVLYPRADVASSCNNPAGTKFPEGGENANSAVTNPTSTNRERPGLWTVFETPSARSACDVVSRLTPGCKQWQRQGPTESETRAHDAARVDKTLVSGLGKTCHVSKLQEPGVTAKRGTQQPHLSTVPTHEFPH